MKLLSYVQFGKGKGIRLVCLSSLLLMVFFGAMIYLTYSRWLSNDEVQKFWNNIPSFSIQNGVAQEKTVRWRGALPLTSGIKVPVVVDTTMDELVLPVAPGAYVTASELCGVGIDGGELVKQCSSFPDNFDVSAESLLKVLKMSVISYIVVVGLIFFMFSLVLYLILAAVSAIIASLTGAAIGSGRVWRSSALAWLLAQILNIILGFAGLTGMVANLSVLAAAIIVDVVLLIASDR